MTGDGAPVMISFGSLLGVPYILCANHTIHLAVTDSLFLKKEKPAGPEDVQSSDDDSDNSSGSGSDSDEDDGHGDHDDDCEDEEEELLIYKPAVIYYEAIRKMREIIKVFRYSPLKSNILQTIQRNAGTRPLKLLTDVKTRWNSLVISAKRFLKILPSVTQALKHKNVRSNFQWDDEDTAVIEVYISFD